VDWKSTIKKQVIANPSQIGKIERGEINTTLSTLKALADVLNVSPKSLLDF
jgi:transcriptional regulator with XRE-family HTH domain